MKHLYQGDLSPSEVWKILEENSDAFLIDVRTSAEWHYVGVPNLTSIGRAVLYIQWRCLPDMSLNSGFVSELVSRVSDKNAKLFFLCRTGGRSMESAIAMTALGYQNCYNVDKGFEGDINPHSHRGLINGWKAEKLPWRQD